MLVRLDSLAQKAEGYKLTKRTTTVLNILKDLNQTLHEGCLLYTSPKKKGEDVKHLLGYSQESEQSMEAVSYTHLDVYKRQLKCSVSMLPVSLFSFRVVLISTEMCIRDSK